MTADVFPTAGLVERAAAAFTASVPDNPADDGFFEAQGGPGSLEHGHRRISHLGSDAVASDERNRLCRHRF